MAKGYSRDQVAEWAGLTRPQLNHIMKLGLVRSELGQVRKRISSLEAYFAIIAAEAMRQGHDPKDLAPVVDWLRQECVSNEVNGTYDNIIMAAEDRKPMYLMYWLSDDGSWASKWSSKPECIEGVSTFTTIDLRHLFHKRSVHGFFAELKTS